LIISCRDRSELDIVKRVDCQHPTMNIPEFVKYRVVNIESATGTGSVTSLLASMICKMKGFKSPAALMTMFHVLLESVVPHAHIITVSKCASKLRKKVISEFHQRIENNNL